MTEQNEALVDAAEAINAVAHPTLAPTPAEPEPQPGMDPDEVLRDPLLREQNRRLGAINDEIASSRAAIASQDQIIAEANAAKVKEKERLARLLKVQRIMRSTVYSLAIVQQDAGS